MTVKPKYTIVFNQVLTFLCGTNFLSNILSTLYKSYSMQMLPLYNTDLVSYLIQHLYINPQYIASY